MARAESMRARALQARDAIELLSDKWRIAVIHVLSAGPLRTGQLQRAIDTVSPKMLTQTLRGMERDGLLERRVEKTVPPHVEYALTEMGYGSIPLLRELCHWAKARSHERDASRARFDAGHGPRPADAGEAAAPGMRLVRSGSSRKAGS